MDSTITQTCYPHFDNGLTDFVPDSWLGEKHSCIWPTFGSEGAKLTVCSGFTTDSQIIVAVLYFGFQMNVAFVLPMLPAQPVLIVGHSCSLLTVSVGQFLDQGSELFRSGLKIVIVEKFLKIFQCPMNTCANSQSKDAR